MTWGRPAADDERADSAGTPSRRELLSALAATGAASGLAGCSFMSDPVPDSFTATPVVLDTTGQQLLEVPSFEMNELRETRTPNESVGEVELVSYLAMHENPTEPSGPRPMRFSVPDPTARAVGLLSMPSPEIGGVTLNPLASKPLGELLRGQRGRDLLYRAGLVEARDFDWRRAPEEIATAEVSMLGTTTEARSFLGVAVGEGDPTTLLMNLARLQYEGDSILLGEFGWRPTPPDPIDVDGACVDDLCQMLSPEQIDMWRRYKRAGEYAATCREVPIGNGMVTEVCGGGGGGGDSGPKTKLRITGARVVQHVEDTVVKQPGSSATYSQSDPDLVAGEQSAVVFEFDTIQNLGAMSDSLELDIYAGLASQTPQRYDYEGTLEFTKKDLRKIKNGESTLAALHRLSNDGDSNENPVFELGSTDWMWLPCTDLTKDLECNEIDIDTITDIDPLKVGFIRLQDENGGSRYGNSNGRPRNYMRSFRSAAEYLQRAYPGDVVVYGHRRHAISGGSSVSGLFKQNCDDDCVVFRDMKRAKRQLDRMATDPSYPNNGPGFPGGGVLRLDGRSQNKMVNQIQNNGFDVVVVIVPENDPSNSGATGYYNFHNMSASGLAWDNPAAAVSSLGASASGGDQRISATVAQEVGHYFQDDYGGPSNHPTAQRDDGSVETRVNNVPVDLDHARHQNSDLRDRDPDGDGTNEVNNPPDPPGVVSTAFELHDGKFTVMESFSNGNGSFSASGPSGSSVNKMESYMSYTGTDRRTWADSRIHQQLIDSGWNAKGSGGSGQPAPMLSAEGGVTEEGAVRYDQVTAYDGVETYPDREDAPVSVTLVDPTDTVLQRVSVPLTIRPTHGADPSTTASFTLPFDDTGVEVRTAYDGGTSRMNPIVRGVRDAVERVPERGFADSPEAARERIGEALDEVAAAMAEDRYGEAAARMDEAVRGRIEEYVVPYEDRLLGQQTLAGLTSLVDDMVERLQAAAEVAG